MMRQRTGDCNEGGPCALCACIETTGSSIKQGVDEPQVASPRGYIAALQGHWLLCLPRNERQKTSLVVSVISWAPGSEVPKLARNCAGSQVGLWLKCSSPAAEIETQLKQCVYYGSRARGLAAETWPLKLDDTT